MFLLLSMACAKNDNSTIKKAEIINFNPNKCMCCWGWTIKVENDTIKSKDAIIGEIIGYNIEYPVSVKIDLRGITKNCSIFSNSINYYEIVNIEKLDN